MVDRAFPGQVSLKCFSQPRELETGINEVMRVAITTWQRGMGQGFQDSAQTRKTFLFFAERGWLRIYILYIKGDPCAFLVGQIYNNNFYCQYAGYHPDFTQFSVGSVLTARAFEDLAAVGVERVDLGEGGQEHNRRIGCQMVEEGTVHVYSPTLRGVWLNLFFGTTQIVRKGGRRARAALKLNRLDKIWRQYLLSRRQFHHQATYASGARKSI
jgi:CelD/BcsL family acetyltransferase involved in cellulose biosynthesis